jgi:hypothetical protein
LVEQRREIRIIARVPGRYSLDRFDARGERQEYACRAVNISPSAVALVGPVVGRLGERVLAHIDHFGQFQGTVGQLLDSGFVMNIIASDDERARLSAKIVWYELYKNHDVSDGRGHDRFFPKNPNASIILSDGTVIDCLVLDISVSGAAIATEIAPEVGTVVALGKIVGRVVRLFSGGFALKFIAQQNKDDVEMLATKNWRSRT